MKASISLAFLFAAIVCTNTFAAEGETAVVTHKAPLAPNHFYALPLGSVKPTGWLREQLRIQANGLSGHLDEFWPDVGPNSSWLGGQGEGWERGPYYVDGLVPLAYLLQDDRLIAKARKWVDWALEHQRSDGAIGPVKNKDWWPNMLMLKALTQYQEATGDPRVIPFLEKYVDYQLKHIEERPLYEWASYQWQDEVLSLIWLYDRTGDNNCLELARVLHKQGYDWEAQFQHFGYTDKVSGPNVSLKTHGVNNAMALKAAAVWSVVSGSDSDRRAAYEMLNQLDRYHLLSNGMHSGDEHYAGLSPSQGVELCAVVEAMFSYEMEIGILGDPHIADRLEKVTFNALPGTFSPDMWAHQYDQQPNQVMATLAKRDWVSNGPDSNTFGLEPNFGCCTANLHQGWPKFAASLWMATPDHGLAAIAYSPSEVNTVVGDGVRVRVAEETEYPFRDSVTLKIGLQSQASFPLQLRIPGWASTAKVSVNGSSIGGVRAGEFARIDRTWKDGDRVELSFPAAVRVVESYHNSVVVERGALVYSLAIGESWHKLKQQGPATDWEIFPTTPWNYGLNIDRQHPEQAFRVEEKPIANQPFSIDSPPVVLRVQAQRVPEWEIQNSSAGPLPVSPITSKLPQEEIQLVPYGSAKLRITNFPWISEPAKVAVAVR